MNEMYLVTYFIIVGVKDAFVVYGTKDQALTQLYELGNYDYTEVEVFEYETYVEKEDHDLCLDIPWGDIQELISDDDHLLSEEELMEFFKE